MYCILWFSSVTDQQQSATFTLTKTGLEGSSLKAEALNNNPRESWVGRQKRKSRCRWWQSRRRQKKEREREEESIKRDWVCTRVLCSCVGDNGIPSPFGWGSNPRRTQKGTHERKMIQSPREAEKKRNKLRERQNEIGRERKKSKRGQETDTGIKTVRPDLGNEITVFTGIQLCISLMLCT